MPGCGAGRGEDLAGPDDALVAVRDAGVGEALGGGPMGGGRGAVEGTGRGEVAGAGADAERPGRRGVHEAEPLDQALVRVARQSLPGTTTHSALSTSAMARVRRQRAHSRCRRRPGRPRRPTNTLRMPGAAAEDLEGADHVEGAEPGVEQVGDQHVFSVWPASGHPQGHVVDDVGHRARGVPSSHGLADDRCDEPRRERAGPRVCPSSGAWSS